MDGDPLLAVIVSQQVEGARWTHDYTQQKRAMLTATKISRVTNLFNLVFPAMTAIVISILAASMAQADATFRT